MCGEETGAPTPNGIEAAGEASSMASDSKLASNPNYVVRLGTVPVSSQTSSGYSTEKFGVILHLQHLCHS